MRRNLKVLRTLLIGWERYRHRIFQCRNGLLESDFPIPIEKIIETAIDDGDILELTF